MRGSRQSQIAPRPARRLRTLAWALGAAAFATAWTGLPATAAPDVFRGDADVVLGETLHAAFPEAPPHPHRCVFFATVGQSISASLVVDAGASLAADVHLASPGGGILDIGSALKSSHTGTQISNYRAPYAGLYVIEVSARRGTGGYTLKTRGSGGTRMDRIYRQAPTDAQFEFYAPSGASLTATVAPRRRGPRLVFTGLVDPSGATLPVLSIQHDAAAELSNVPLPLTGKYAVQWTNHGSPGDVNLSFRFVLPAVPGGTRDLGTSDGLAVTVVEKGDPQIAARSGYVGSAVCGRCHTDLLRTWSSTAHNSAVRAWNRAGLSGRTIVNDLDGDGVDDFRAGLDLASTPAFAAYGFNAPKLSYGALAGPSDTTSPLRVRIANTTYVVDFTMGGNGLWKQQYLVKVGTSYQVLPFEFDETTRTYAAYRVEDWYDASHAPLAAPPKARSYEAQCSGCHETGETLESDGAGGVRTGFVERNIGCEQCHGPGAEHAVQGDTRKIKNPRRLLADKSAAGVAAANDICARCHTKGQSTDPLPGMTAKAEFGFRGDHGVSQAGDVVADFVKSTQDPVDFWGAKTNPMPALPGDTTLASRSDRQQANDIAVGEHASGNSETDSPAPACFECHDPHARVNAHQVATVVDRGVRVPTRAQDNSLCLACHAGDEFFPGISASDVIAISSSSPPASIARAVIDHMKDNGMPVREGLYDPVSTGVGRCVTCHMPKTPTSGPTTKDKAGFAAGDLHAHRFEIVWPRASTLYGVTNSCNVCHPTDPQDQVGPIIAQWSNAPGSSHAATPGATQDGRALNAASNPGKNGGVLCIQCHAAEGFARVRVGGETLPPEEVNVIAKESVQQDRGLTCDACHGRRSDGAFHGEDRNPLRFDKAELCGECHNAETVEFEDFQARGEIVRHPQQEMLVGTAGAPAPGAPATTTSSHSFFADACVTCHFDTTNHLDKHDFLPNVATCASCHPGLATFDRTARGDYDGNGAVQGVQTEVNGLLVILKSALLLDSRVTFAGGYFDFAGATNHAMTGASDAQKRAVFNWYSVSDDRSRGVHNTGRAVQLLQKSYRELTGADVPGAVLR